MVSCVKGKVSLDRQRVRTNSRSQVLRGFGLLGLCAGMRFGERDNVHGDWNDVHGVRFRVTATASAGCGTLAIGTIAVCVIFVGMVGAGR